jgi:hypothetical protein
MNTKRLALASLVAFVTTEIQATNTRLNLHKHQAETDDATRLQKANKISSQDTKEKK